MFRKIFTATIPLVLAVSSQAQVPENNPKLPPKKAPAVKPQSQLPQELENIFSVIENQYGPLQIKATTIGLDWEKTKAAYRSAVTSIDNSNDFYYLVADLLSQFNDAHVSVQLPSELTFKLPMQFSFVENKTIVTYVAETFPKDSKQPQIGDELIAINGTTVNEFKEGIPLFNKYGNSRTNSAYFARALTSLSEASGFPLSEISPDITFTLKGADNATYDLKLKYKKSGLGIINRPTAFFGKIYMPEEEKEIDLIEKSGFFPSLSDQDREELSKTIEVITQFNGLFDLGTSFGTKADSAPVSPGKGKRMILAEQKPFYPLPSNFREIRPPGILAAALNADSFFAGTFDRNGKRIGLLRLPSYMPGIVYTLVASLRYYIGRLQNESDVLIIDQTNNPGGAVIFSDLLIKSLTGKLDNSKHLRFAVKPTQGFMRQFTTLMQTVAGLGDIITPEQKKALLLELATNFKKIHTAFVEGKNLSEPISLATMSDLLELLIDASTKKFKGLMGPASWLLLGVNVLEPKVYTKPISFLINELDFSGGDATPASFQDYGRGRLVGVRTAGAGGTVEQFSHRFSTEFTFNLTTSLMVRKDGKLVENYGVQPDINVELSVQDYKDGFKNFLGKVLTSLNL